MLIMKDIAAPGVIYAAGVNTATYANPYSFAGLRRRRDQSGRLLRAPRCWRTATRLPRPEPLSSITDRQPRRPSRKGRGRRHRRAARCRGRHQGDRNSDANGNTVYKKVPQYYQPWLLSNSGVTPSAGASILGAGVFAPVGTQIASQTAWWIQYGSFQQGFLSAGGNVSVLAGRNMLDVSVSAPTTGRVTGGLSANSTPVTHLYGSGNMVVRAGGDIRGGSFYEDPATPASSRAATSARTIMSTGTRTARSSFRTFRCLLSIPGRSR